MPAFLTALLTNLAEQAAFLTPVLLAAVLVGEPLARLLRLPALRLALGGTVAALNHKLNRARRSTATRLYRGIVALGMLLLPALAAAFLLMRGEAWIALLGAFLLVAFFGELLRPYEALRLRRAARAGTLTLQSHNPPYLFADTHALLRYQILTAGERFALTIGGSLAFLLADWAGLATYFTLAAAARFYSPAFTGNRAFGWAAGALFGLVDAVPRAVAALLLWCAALFTPRTRPFAPLRHFGSASARFYGWLAYLLHLALGGPVPTAAGDLALPWIGTGTPKPEAAHFTRALALVAIASLIWILLLEAMIYLLPADK